MGPSFAAGHRVRGERPTSEPSRVDRVDVLVVGGGIAGLAAARALKQHGVASVKILELEATVGGNSRFGENHVTRFPLGAHYVPIINHEVEPLRELFSDLGVITEFDARGLPTYDEFFLCADPVERLFMYGRWHESLHPTYGQSSDDAAQAKKFRGLVQSMKLARGRDGRRAFAMPIDQSSEDPAFRGLDRVSMADYLAANGLTSARLRWYVDYCCRDDYGADSGKVSAWAGLYYYASRSGQAVNASPESLLTWPEGNGWLVERLAAGLTVETKSLVLEIADRENGARVDYVDLRTEEHCRTEALYVVCALPQLVAGRVVRSRDNGMPRAATTIDYVPWVVTNLTLSVPPTTKVESALAWDNVSYHSKSLGYVVANHQSLKTNRKETVITHYQPMDTLEPRIARQITHTLSHFDWQTLVLADLEGMHPGITASVENLDVWIWGHGMVLPKPGSIWGGDRTRSASPVGNIHFAHSDTSGVSVFEEAFLQGAEVGKRVATLAKQGST